jgi:site-specific recombinase XerD
MRLPMFLSKHSNGTYYLFYYNEQGRRKRVSTHCQYKTDAMNFLQSFKRDEYERRQKAKHKLLSEFLTAFLSYAEGSFSKGTVAIYKATLRNFIKYIGDFPLANYTPQHFDIYKTERQKPVKVITVKDGHKTEREKIVRPVTVNIELRTLRAFFNTALRWKLLESNPFKVQLVRIPENKPTFLTKQDFQKLLSVIEEHWLKEVIVFAVSTGLRRGELVNLKWESVDLSRKLLYIESSATFRTKAGRMRIIPLNETAFFLLQSKQGKDTSGYAFSLNDKKLHADWITHLFKRYVRQVNLSNQSIHFHSLRHSFASWLAQDGTSVYVIKDLLGHSDVKTTQIYSHLQPESLHSEVNKISVSMN